MAWRRASERRASEGNHRPRTLLPIWQGFGWSVPRSRLRLVTFAPHLPPPCTTRQSAFCLLACLLARKSQPRPSLSACRACRQRHYTSGSAHCPASEMSKIQYHHDRTTRARARALSRTAWTPLRAASRDWLGVRTERGPGCAVVELHHVDNYECRYRMYDMEERTGHDIHT